MEQREEAAREDVAGDESELVRGESVAEDERGFGFEEGLGERARVFDDGAGVRELARARILSRAQLGIFGGWVDERQRLQDERGEADGEVSVEGDGGCRVVGVVERLRHPPDARDDVKPATAVVILVVVRGGEREASELTHRHRGGFPRGAR